MKNYLNLEINKWRRVLNVLIIIMSKEVNGLISFSLLQSPTA
jgi:hypothetical protein